MTRVYWESPHGISCTICGSLVFLVVVAGIWKGSVNVLTLLWGEWRDWARTFLKSVTPWRWALGFLRESVVTGTVLTPHLLRQMPGSWCAADWAWPGEGFYTASRLMGCLFSPLADRVSDNWCIIFIEGHLLFFKLETPNLLTGYVLDSERVCFSMTGKSWNMAHFISHILFLLSPSCQNW